MNLQLFLILLLVGVAEADDFRFELPKPYDPPQVDAKIIWCTNGVCASPCEQKMKEAMKLMDKIMRGEWVHTPYNTYEYQSMVPSAQERARWEAIYKECVK